MFWTNFMQLKRNHEHNTCLEGGEEEGWREAWSFGTQGNINVQDGKRETYWKEINSKWVKYFNPKIKLGISLALAFEEINI